MELLKEKKYDVKHQELKAQFLVDDDNSQLFSLEFKPEKPVGNIFIISPFGKTTHDLFLIAYYLYKNGFNIYRFDPRNHVGLSSGIMENFNLSSLEKDTQLFFNKINYDRSLPSILVSISLSFPVALKFASIDSKFNSLISLVPAVNPNDTSEKVAECNLDEYRNNSENAPKYRYPFGYKMLGAQYVKGLDEGGFATLDDLSDYVKKLSCPLHMIVSGNDEYVSLKDSELFRELLPEGSQYILQNNLSHEIGRSISAAKLVTKAMTALALQTCGISSNLVLPPLTEIIMKGGSESDFLNQLK